MPTKLRRAGRRFLLRLIYELGPDEAVMTLRSLADEIERLMRANLAPEVVPADTSNELRRPIGNSMRRFLFALALLLSACDTDSNRSDKLIWDSEQTTWDNQNWE